MSDSTIEYPMEEEEVPPPLRTRSHIATHLEGGTEKGNEQGGCKDGGPTPP